MRHRRRERGVLSTRQLMGIEQITDCYIQTAHGDLIFFIIQPTNISVLPQAGIEARILSLLNVLRSQQEMELLAMNSRESFENNKAFYQARMEQETSPKIRELLAKDRAHLDEIQVLSTLAREFYLVLRLNGKKERSVLPYLSRIEKSIQDSGFTVRVADKLLLRQLAGFYCVSPIGFNICGEQFERVLPASSVANLYPFNYSGKTDPRGFYIGKDRYGSNVLVDFDQRDADKTSANVLILGNSGQGKSFLMKLLLVNFLEAGKTVITLDVEHEQQELCNHLDGCFADLMAGYYKINVLEPKSWGADADPSDPDTPEAFRKKTRLAQHISFLKDFFRSYKHFEDAHIDTIEIMLGKLYARFGITEQTDFQKKKPTDYPILSDLYDLIAEEYHNYDSTNRQLYSQELLQEILLGLHSMCKGSDSQFFNGHTNVTSQRFLVFGVKGLITAAENVKNAMLFNILSYMTDQLLNAGNTVAALDELYIWLSNLTTITYIRNALKRVRKKESAIVMASQNLEDFDQEGVRELTRPLFSIPPHQFLFNPGSISPKAYMDMLQLEPAEFELIKYPHNGHCLYKCGNERYHLQVIAPEYKRVLFGEAGGR